MKLFLAIEVESEEDAHWRLQTLRTMAPEVCAQTDCYCIGSAIGVGSAAAAFQLLGEQFDTPFVDDAFEDGEDMTAAVFFEKVEQAVFGGSPEGATAVPVEKHESFEPTEGLEVADVHLVRTVRRDEP